MQNTDTELNSAAKIVIARIHAILPEHLATELENSSLLISSGKSEANLSHLSVIRKAISHRNKLRITCADKNDALTSRDIWPDKEY